MRVITVLATLADVDGKSGDRAALVVFVRVHCAIVAQAAHELIIGWRYQSEAIVLIIRDRRGECLEIMRALYKLSNVCGAHHGIGSDGLGKKTRAPKRRRCWRRQRARVDSGELIIAVHPVGN